MPTISFFLATPGHPVDRVHPLWAQPLPQRRSPEKTTPKRDEITYGDLFSSVHHFCASDGWHRLRTASSTKLGRDVGIEEIGHVYVFLAKHGAFYHPARIQFSIDDQPLSFVINVAASASGKKTLPIEVNALKRLNAERPFGWFPTVYEAQFDDLPLFLADWFEGFHEFHLTQQQDLKEPAITVWDGAAEPSFLSPNQAGAVYRDASMILTASYDLLTGSQIFPGHHAAGDFVVRTQNGKVMTRLITVRGYAPMVVGKSEPRNEAEIVELLLLFLIHLSIRMRLDRFDGVSDVAWVPDRYLASIVGGFFRGLELTTRMAGFPESFPALLRLFLARQPEKQLLFFAQQIAASIYDDGSDEADVIEKHLEIHIRCLKQFVSL